MPSLRNLFRFLRDLARSDPGDRLDQVHDRHAATLDTVEYTRITDMR